MEIGKALGLWPEEKENVVGYLGCCREDIYANVMISRNIYGRRIEILPWIYFVILDTLGRRGRGDTAFN